MRQRRQLNQRHMRLRLRRVLADKTVFAVMIVAFRRLRNAIRMVMPVLTIDYVVLMMPVTATVSRDAGSRLQPDMFAVAVPDQIMQPRVAQQSCGRVRDQRQVDENLAKHGDRRSVSGIPSMRVLTPRTGRSLASVHQRSQA